jgi:hydrogenase nickel incorporation protein HypA/HybF
MHEMSIALGIVRIAEEEVKKAKANKVESIELIIGTLSGVEKDALDFAWPVAVKDTVLEGAKRIVDYVKGEGKCSECNCIFPLENLHGACPKCNSYFKDILKGRELRVVALEVV